MSTASLVATRCPSQAAMSLLHRGVPLSLLLDLVLGPRSEELFATEIPAPRPEVSQPA
ncbi:MAG: hypothetical protein WD794_00280 [Mycobacteriales bacterium]